MQEDELVGVQWMPLEEFLAIPFNAGRPLFMQARVRWGWAASFVRPLPQLPPVTLPLPLYPRCPVVRRSTPASARMLRGATGGHAGCGHGGM